MQRRGIALHYFPSVPDYAASHGCVRLELEHAAPSDSGQLIGGPDVDRCEWNLDETAKTMDVALNASVLGLRQANLPLIQAGSRIDQIGSTHKRGAVCSFL
jgi:hypothetical protein